MGYHYKLQVCPTSRFVGLHLPAVRIYKLIGSFEEIQACNCVGIYCFYIALLNKRRHS